MSDTGQEMADPPRSAMTARRAWRLRLTIEPSVVREIPRFVPVVVGGNRSFWRSARLLRVIHVVLAICAVVRSSPKSGDKADTTAGLSCANTGREQSQQIHEPSECGIIVCPLRRSTHLRP